MCMDLFSVLLLWKTYEQRIRHNKQKHYFNYFGKTMAQIVFLLIVPGLRSFCFKKISMFVTIRIYIYIYIFNLYLYII